MGLGKWTGVEPVLPQIAGSSQAGLEVVGVPEMSAPETFGHGILPLRSHDEVDVAGHQTVLARNIMHMNW
jgi:hypothetical protein